MMTKQAVAVIHHRLIAFCWNPSLIMVYIQAYKKRLAALISPTFWLVSRTHQGIISVPYGHHIDQVVQETLKLFIQGDVFL